MYTYIHTKIIHTHTHTHMYTYIHAKIIPKHICIHIYTLKYSKFPVSTVEQQTQLSGFNEQIATNSPSVKKTAP